MDLFDGITFDKDLDGERLSGQLLRVFNQMRDGRWYTLSYLATLCGGSEAGVSARIRDLRKARFGGHLIERRRRGDQKGGLWEYRLRSFGVESPGGLV